MRHDGSIMVTIYGKDTCPYTNAAIEDHERRKVAFDYKNVKKDPVAMKEMLAWSDGQRLVPVIVRDGRVEIGFGGT